MIKLYKASESSFTDNGLGFLNDAITCAVTEHLNGEYELEMTYPVYGLHYNELQMDRLILVKEKGKEKPQAFRIYSISKPINQIVTVQAQHISYDLSGIAVKGALENYAYTVPEVFEYIRRCAIVPCPFNFYTSLPEAKSNMCLSKPRSVRAILGTDDDGILTLFGGEYEFDMYDVILHQTRGSDNGVSIVYGKNLTDLTQEENISEMFTGVYPYYFVEDDGLQYLDDGPITIIPNASREKILSLDLTSEFDEMPTQEVLKETAMKYVTENKLTEPKVSLNVSFITDPDLPAYLQDVKLGDTLTVKFPKLGVNTKSRVITTTYNCITGMYDSMELGDPVNSIVDSISSINGDVASNSMEITNIKVKVQQTSDAIYQTIEDTNGNLNSLTETVSGVSRRLQSAQGDITTLQARADGFDASISDAQGNIASLQGRADGFDISIANAEQEITDANGNITKAQGDIHTLSLRADGADAAISNAQGDILTLQTRADGFTTAISNAQGDITALEARADGFDVSIEGAEKEITDANGNISTLQSSVHTLSVRADGFDSSISNAQGDITWLSSRCGTIETAITNMSDDTNSRFNQTSNEISAEVGRATGAENSISASLSLKVDKNDNDQVVSMLNASANYINITSNRLYVDSDNFKLQGSSLKIGPFSVNSSGLYISGGAYGDIDIGASVVKTPDITSSNNVLVFGVYNNPGASPACSFYTPNGYIYINNQELNPNVIIHLNSSRMSIDYTSAGNVKIESCHGFTSEQSSGYGNIATVGYVKSKVSSDERIKKNRVDIPDITDIYMDIPIYQFEYDGIDEREGICFGTTAQGVETAFTKHGLDVEQYNIVGKRAPSLFNGEFRHIPNGDQLHYINWENINGMSIYMIQKLVTKVKELENEIKNLKQSIGGN